MAIYVNLQSIFLTFFVLNCVKATVDEKCNFADSQFQPKAFKLLSKSVVPSLESNEKGDSGKIGVIGGSTEYTGAPYFAAITALKTGADLVYVITTESASPIIKSYSPDLIVYPFLSPKYASKIRALLPKMHLVVLGPGLGREDETMRLVYDIIADCRSLKKPMIIDADGLFAISKNVTILKDYPCPGIIMTPNRREVNKLMESVSNNVNVSNWYTYWGPCVSVLVKGEKDYFFNNVSTLAWVATGGGSCRRVSGQGDILAGALGTFYNWALKTEICKNVNNTLLAQSVASYAAAKFTRMCNYRAYVHYGRNTIASDMIEEIHPAFDALFLESS